MKKIIIAAALVLSASILLSQVKVNNVPKTEVLAIQKTTVSADRKDLATAD